MHLDSYHSLCPSVIIPTSLVAEMLVRVCCSLFFLTGLFGTTLPESFFKIYSMIANNFQQGVYDIPSKALSYKTATGLFYKTMSMEIPPSRDCSGRL